MPQCGAGLLELGYGDAARRTRAVRVSGAHSVVVGRQSFAVAEVIAGYPQQPFRFAAVHF